VITKQPQYLTAWFTWVPLTLKRSRFFPPSGVRYTTQRDGCQEGRLALLSLRGER
jgi:hypothetical protein